MDGEDKGGVDSDELDDKAAASLEGSIDEDEIDTVKKIRPDGKEKVSGTEDIDTEIIDHNDDINPSVSENENTAGEIATNNDHNDDLAESEEEGENETTTAVGGGINVAGPEDYTAGPEAGSGGFSPRRPQPNNPTPSPQTTTTKYAATTATAFNEERDSDTTKLVDANELSTTTLEDETESVSSNGGIKDILTNDPTKIDPANDALNAGAEFEESVSTQEDPNDSLNDDDDTNRPLSTITDMDDAKDENIITDDAAEIKEKPETTPDNTNNNKEAVDEVDGGNNGGSTSLLTTSTAPAAAPFQSKYSEIPLGQLVNHQQPQA